MFSALRQGSPIYVLEKGDILNLKIGQVESVSQPRPKYNTYNPTLGFGNIETIVDIIVRFGNDKKEYIGIPSNLSIHGYGDVVISENKEAMISEVDGMLQSSKSIIESVDYHRNVISACETILKQLNPVYAKEQERDSAIDDLKSEVESLHKQIAKMTELLSKAETK